MDREPVNPFAPAITLEPTVAVGGLGAIGYSVAEAVDREPAGLRLAAVSARDLDRARIRTEHFRRPPAVVTPQALAECQIVVEAAPVAAFDSIVIPALEQGRTIIIASASALLARLHLLERAHATGASLIVPSGALAGLDAIRAAAIGMLESVTLETRKPPASIAGAPYLLHHGIDLTGITSPTCVFRGNAREAAAGFPANANVAAALALAGIGSERTRVEIWADPNVKRNTHTVRAVADCATLTFCIESVPSPDNPRTSRLAAQSVLACLRSMVAKLRVGG
ncbi:MAG: aspartate dehydrogenase [Steroidobacteraceae bacterium]